MVLSASVIIPTYNKSKYLNLTLASFIKQTYPIDGYEIVIVDDGSTDETEKIVSMSKLSCRIKYIRQGNLGRAAARNTGIESASGEVLIFTDDDCIVEPDFIEQHMRYHENGDNKIVSGIRYDTISIIPVWEDYISQKFLKENPYIAEIIFNHLGSFKAGAVMIKREDIIHEFQKVRELKSEKTFPAINNKNIYSLYGSNLEGCSIPWVFFITSNVSVKKQDLLSCGLFDSDFKGWGLEDWEMGYRLYRNGIHTYISIDAINYHQRHSRDMYKGLKEEVYNYQRFCNKHPYFEVYLNWKYRMHIIDIYAYDAIVKQFYLLNPWDYTDLISDYFNVVKQQADEHIKSMLVMTVPIVEQVI